MNDLSVNRNRNIRSEKKTNSVCDTSKILHRCSNKHNESALCMPISPPSVGEILVGKVFLFPALVIPPRLRVRYPPNRVNSSLVQRVDEQKSIVQRQLQALSIEEENRRDTLALAVENLTKEIVLYQNELCLREENLRAHQQREQRYRSLQDKNLIATDALIELQQAIRNTKAEIQQRLALITERQSIKQQSQQELKGIGNEYEKQRLILEERLINLSSRDAELLSQSGAVITAPIDGIVTGLQVTTGQRVTPQVVLASIEPENPHFQGVAYATSKAIGFIESDQPVNLMYDAFPYQRFGVFGAKIDRVSDTTLLPSEVVGPIQTTEPVYRITVTLNNQTIQTRGRELNLQDGMMFTADIVLENRSLTQWILEPLYSVSER